MAVALFLWYAYNNQDKFDWLNWFFKLFKKGAETTPASPLPDPPMAMEPAPDPLPPVENVVRVDPVVPVVPGGSGGAKPGGGQGTQCPPNNACRKGDKPAMRNKKCHVCKKVGGCFKWTKVNNSRCKKKSGFTPMAPMAGYETPLDSPFRAYTTVPSYQPPTLAHASAAPIAYNERF